MTPLYLGLGTNVGDKESNLRLAVQQIEKRIGGIHSLSSFYQTDPWGFISEHTFLNAVVHIDTVFSPEEVLQITQDIERNMGRKIKSSAGVYTDRIIDIDILFYGEEIISLPYLQIPHSLLHERMFVLEPLCEIAPNLIHPTLKKSVSEIKNTL